MSQHNRSAQIIERIQELASISEEQGCVTRRLGTPAFVKGAQRVAAWMKEAGLQTRIDVLGNVRGRWNADQPHAKTLVIASHIDTVVNAGKYDGPLGVIMGISLIENLKLKFSALPFNIELIAFSDEEGVRFHTTFLGSSIVTGHFDKAWLHKTDEAGIRLEEALQVFDGDLNELDKDAIPSHEWLGYFEMHIEQGPVLYNQHIPVAVVRSIAGQKRISLTIDGFAGHAGTVPMDMRQDALCAAAECTLAIEKFATEQKDRLVATVGTLQVVHAASNVIPGQVALSVDIRSADSRYLHEATTHIQQICEQIVFARKVTMTWKQVQQTEPVITDVHLNGLLKQAIHSAGLPLVELMSGAGHDAVPVAQVAPVAMMFIRCYKGISHHPEELAEPADITSALQVADRFMENIIEHYSSSK
jgi:allantoate deiminase